MIGVASFLALLFVGVEASALQPLQTFVDGARTSNNQRKVARASREQAEGQATAALGTNLPSLNGTAALTHSQLDPPQPANGDNGGGSLRIPRNIYYLSGGITVPLSVGNWEKHAASRAQVRSAHADERATAITVQRSVTQAYYEVVGAEAVLGAVKHRLELAQSNANVILARAKEGESSALDVERSRNDVARAQQDVADADGNVLRARRRLFSLTQVDPEPGTTPDLLADDLHSEGPASAWMARNQTTRPAVEKASAQREAAARNRDAAAAAWLPTVSAQVAENYTNLTESLGRKDFYTVLGIAQWKLDLTKAGTQKAESAALAGAKAAEAQARLDSQDAVYDAWVQVETDIAKVRSARVGAASAKHAMELSREQYAAGESTQIEVLQAEQDYVEAEVARVRVDADLAYARAALRLAVADGNDPAAR